MNVVPFLLEDILNANGDLYERAADRTTHVIDDDKLVTAQYVTASDETTGAQSDSLKSFSVSSFFGFVQRLRNQ